MDSNFVNIIGYQFEKVHTGVIRWLLDSKNGRVPMEQKYEVFKEIYEMCEKKLEFGCKTMAISIMQKTTMSYIKLKSIAASIYLTR